jgi:hypothetical protein
MGGSYVDLVVGQRDRLKLELPIAAKNVRYDTTLPLHLREHLEVLSESSHLLSTKP